MDGRACRLPLFPPPQFLDCCPSSRTSCCNHAAARAGRNAAVASGGAGAGFRQQVVVVVDTLMLAPPPATSSQVLLTSVTPVWVNCFPKWYDVIVYDWLVTLMWLCVSDPLGAFTVLFINIFLLLWTRKVWVTSRQVVKVWPEVRCFCSDRSAVMFEDTWLKKSIKSPAAREKTDRLLWRSHCSLPRRIEIC